MSQKNQFYWQFSQIPNIEESNFNKILERFYDLKVSGLVRENIQNSLDGKLNDFEGPVIVKINTGEIEKGNIPGIEELIGRIKCLEGHNSYTKETIKHMLNRIDQTSVSYISFEDKNTKGLTGAKFGQSDSKDHTWGIYAYNKGVHFEDSDSEFETVRGGSHGVGKIASNAASDIHVMFFANCDQNGEKHLGGTIQLIEHRYNDGVYRASGYFAKTKENDKTTQFMPYENKFDEVFKKDTRGLKIIIPYLREGYDETKNIITSVCDSFFISILTDKLVVEVNDTIINSDTIHDIVNSSAFYEQRYEHIKKEFTPLYVNTYEKMVPKEITVSNGLKNYHFKLYFNYDEKIIKGRVAIVRTIGMKIEDFKVKNNATKPFNAVLIGGSEEDSYLKSLENESHTELSSDHIKDLKLQKHAKKFLNNLSSEISKIIDQFIIENNPVDGTIDTKDILYIEENKFKKDLESSIATVMINDKQIIKTKTSINKKEKRNKKENRDISNSGQGTKTRKPLKLQKSPQGKYDEGNELTKKYSTDPEMVERVILQDHEHLFFDFSSSEEFVKNKKCNISLVLIDGMGIEHTDEFILKDNYLKIYNPITKKRYSIENNYISDVDIVNGKVELDIELSAIYNRSLKFVYYVEVPNDL